MIDQQLHQALQDEYADVALATPVSDIVRRGRSMRRQYRRRRVAAFTLIPAFGLAGAAVAGALPSPISDLLPWTTSAELASIDWDSAERLAVLSAPGGQRMEFWSATGDDDMTCLTHLQVSGEAPEATRLPESARASASGAACAQGDVADQDFSVSSITRGTSAGVLVGSAGDAVRAELQLLNGEVVPLVVTDGWLLGSFVGTEVPGSLVGYDSDDRRVGTIDLLGQTATID